MNSPFTTDPKPPVTSLDGAHGTAGTDDEAGNPLGGMSHVRGDRSQPLWNKTVWQVLEDAATARPEGAAAVFREHAVTYTWASLRAAAARLADGLLALGLAPGDRLGIWSPNRPEWLLTQFATARIGVILVTINPAYRTSELEYALGKSGCKAIVLAERFKSSDYVQMLRAVVPEVDDAKDGIVRSKTLPTLRHVIGMGEHTAPGFLRFDDLPMLGGTARTQRADSVAARLSADEPINIQFTSGTTGAPKGATLTHNNIVNNARSVVTTMGLGATDRLCIPVPLYHCFGMVMGTLGCATVGATMVFASEAFEPLATLEALEQEQCTGLYGVPTMFVAMLDHPEFSQRDLSRMRTGIMAGAPCPIEVMKRVLGDMHMSEITIAYGMTETSPVSFQSAVDCPLDKRVATVGRVLPHVEVKVVDEHGKTVPVGESGELCTRGYSVMRGYWEDEERTSDAIDADGWMHTGDLATLDEKGYCNIVGRVKDMLIRGGENVYPREIEEFLFTHPQVAEAQVFGIPDERLGEQVCTWIVLRPDSEATEEDIIEFCRGRIAHFKVPKHVRFKDALPMTVTGKPQKFIMREAMMEELGLSEQKTA